jgi:hypothetical protein
MLEPRVPTTSVTNATQLWQIEASIKSPYGGRFDHSVYRTKTTCGDSNHTLRPVFMSNETPPSMQIDPNFLKHHVSKPLDHRDDAKGH